MVQTPILVPIKSSDNSYTQKCLEKPELNALYKKALNQEEFSDEDVAKLGECVEDLKESNATMCITALVVALAVLVVVIIVVIALS